MKKILKLTLTDLFFVTNPLYQPTRKGNKTNISKGKQGKRVKLCYHMK